MRTVELGTTGEKISAIGLGAMGMGTLADDETSFATLDAYADDGGTFLDTADCYAWFYGRGTTGGQSEELLGRWLARTGRRMRTFIATKGSGAVLNTGEAWPAGRERADWGKVRFAGAGAGALRTALEGSLRRLGTDHVDLYYVHVDDRSTPLEETLETLAGFVAAGQVRHLGWSNVRSWRLERIRALCEAHGWPQPVALQQLHTFLPPRSGAENASLVGDEQLDYLKERDDLTLVAYAPLLKGSYDLPPAERLASAALGDHSDGAERRLAVLDQVAAELGATPGQVVIAWQAAQRSPRVVPLIGTTRVERYRSSARALDLALSDEQLARLDAATR